MAKRIKRDGKGQAIANLIMEQYQPKNKDEMQDALKDVFAPMLEALLQGEMDNHLGYSPNDHSTKTTNNRRNGYTNKTVRSSYGEIPVSVPRDREGSFEPQAIPKRSKDITGIEDKVLAMYARGMSQRDISSTINEIYGCELSAESISNITDRILDEIESWQNRPVKPCYPFIFVDCMYVPIRQDYETKSCAVYVILGYDLNGEKDILGLWISDTEGKHNWMQIFDELKARGLEDVVFISMDGVSGLEEGAKSIFPDVVVQRCIVHLIRNSIKYVPSKDYKAFTAHLKKIYGAVNLKNATAEFERFKEAWKHYPGAGAVWERNWIHVEQLFRYGSAVRKVMYTTNAIESVNSSFRKVTKKGAFQSENSVKKALYLRIQELYKKWNSRPITNWAMVRNQLAIDENIQARILKYEQY